MAESRGASGRSRCGRTLTSRLDAQEPEERLEVVTVGRAKCRDVLLSYRSRPSWIATAPREWTMSFRPEERVCDQAGVSAVPVWKWTDVCKLGMETSRCFINCVDALLQPARGILAQVTDGHRHFSPVYPDVLVCRSVLSGPLPCFVEHPPVKLSHTGRREYITLWP